MSEKADHLLKTIWLMRERCIVDSDKIMSQVPLSVRATAKMLQRNGHVSIQNGTIKLLPKGHEKAEVLIRRHLLAERLLSDVLLVGEKEVAKSACAFEHILSEEVTESVCTFLGHPPLCPHGIAIPRGNCCSTFSTEVKPLVHRLTDLQIGELGKITFITPGRNKTLDRLAIFGVVPGNTVKLEQRKPSYVIQVDETVLALEADLCDKIFVKKLVPLKMSQSFISQTAAERQGGP